MKRSVVTVICAALVAVAFAVYGGMGKAPSPDLALQEAERVEIDISSGTAQAGAHEQDVDALEDPAPIDETLSTPTKPSKSSVVEDAEYEPNVVLVEVADTLSIDEINEQIASLDYVAIDSISEYDIQYGFVELPLAQDIDVQTALDMLEHAEFAAAAQPNYVYHIVDESYAAPSDEPAASGDGAVGALQVASSPDLISMNALDSTINDPYASSQWALEAVKAYGAWDYSRGNHRVTVAVLDSGLDTDHPDFKDDKGTSLVVGGRSIISADGSATANPADYDDVQGHGTHVAGIIAAGANNGKGVAGVSYNANIMPVRVMSSSGSVTSADAAAGIAYVVENASAYNVKVMNLSFGTQSNETSTRDAVGDKALAAALKKAHDANILVVFASGNGGANGAYNCYPCDSDPEAIGVINIKQSGSNGYARSSSSNYNKSGQTTKELSAPGDDIFSTTYDGSYGLKSGTSMAAPYVSGVAALVFAANPNMTAAEVKQALIDTAQDLNTSQNIAGMGQFDLQTGYGLVNAEAAVKASASYLSDGDTLAVGGSLQLSVLNPLSPGWSWASDTTSVATVDAAGNVYGVSAGKATITATSSDNVILRRVVNVYDPTISGATTLEYGSLLTLSVSSANPGPLVWSSSDTSIVAVGATSGQVRAMGLGQADITVHVNGYPEISSTVSVTVTKADLSNAVLDGVSDQAFAGVPVTLANLAVRMPDYTRYPYYNSCKLVDGTGVDTGDYAVSYSNNTAKGTATVTVTAKESSNYKGSKSATFEIGDGTVEEASYKATWPEDCLVNGVVTYTGNPIKMASLTVTSSSGAVLVEGRDYEVVYPDDPADYTNAGTIYVTINGLNDYVGSISLYYTIAAASIKSDAVVVSGISSKTYNGQAQTQAPVLTYKGKKLSLGTDYQLLYANNVNVGTATMRIVGLGNFATSTFSGLFPQPVYRYESFTINPKPISSAVISVPAQTYAAKALTPAPTVKMGSTTLSSGTDYTTAYSNNVNAGTATITVTGKGNYTGTKSGTFKINPASISGATVSVAAQTYTGKALTPAPIVKVGATTLKLSTDYMTAYSNNVNIGTGYVTITGVRNYTGSRKVGFSILAAAAAPTITGATEVPVGAKATYTLTNSGTVTIKSGSQYASLSGKVLTGTASGTVVLSVRDSAGAERSTKTVTIYALDGSWELQSALNSNMVLDIYGAGITNAANMIIWPRNNGANQRFRFASAGSGYYSMEMVHSGKKVDVDSASKSAGHRIIQWPSNNGVNQQWSLSVDANNYVTFTSRNSGMVIDVDGARAVSGRQVIQWPLNNGLNQKWKLVKRSNAGVLEERGYRLRAATNTGFAADVAGASGAAGANVALWVTNGGANQRFQIIDCGSGYVRIAAYHSGNVLDVSGGRAYSGANVLQWTWKNSANQKWKVVRNDDGTYSFLSAVGPSYALTWSGSARAGANLQLAAWTKASNQRFSLAPL